MPRRPSSTPDQALSEERSAGRLEGMRELLVRILRARLGRPTVDALVPGVATCDVDTLDRAADLVATTRDDAALSAALRALVLPRS